MENSEFIEKIKTLSATAQTKKDLDDLLAAITEHKQDYDTIIASCVAAMSAVRRVVSKQTNYGLSGHQAVGIGWEMLREFMFVTGPARVIEYNHLLNPDNEAYFEKTITSEVWDHLRKTAKANIEAPPVEGFPPPSQALVSHWRSVAAGNLPFGFVVRDE